MRKKIIIFIVFFLSIHLSADIKRIDLSGELLRQSFPEEDKSKYYGNPSSIMLEDSISIILCYPDGPNYPGTVIKKSIDGGKSWSDRFNVPLSFQDSHYNSTIHKITDTTGSERLMILVGRPEMKLAYSDDNGETWSDFFLLFPDDDIDAFEPPANVIPIFNSSGNPVNGHFFTVFYSRISDETGSKYGLLITRTYDGGISWSKPEPIEVPAELSDLELVYPALIRSPDKKNIICLCSDYRRNRNNLLLKSTDEGMSWEFAGETNSELTGEKHRLIYGKDNQVISVFVKYGKDYTDHPYSLDIVCWLGHFDDLLDGNEGEYLVRVFENRGNNRNTGSSGLHFLKDGSIVVISSTILKDGEKGRIASFSFQKDDLERVSDIPVPEEIEVFYSGMSDYHTFRIPAVLTTLNGTVLAFAEGRAGLSDQSGNDIVFRRSLDHGYHWEDLQLVSSLEGHALNNPELVQDENTGRIFCMFQSYPDGKTETSVEPGIEGDNICKGYVIYSDNDGETWSQMEEITQYIKRPEYVTSIASGPGIGIQLKKGEHSGRLIFPFNQGPWGDWKVYTVFSDDGGNQWQYGETALDGSSGHGNEVQMIELENGNLLLNCRGIGGNKYRKKSISTDGGITWSPLEIDSNLIEPECQASIFRLSYNQDSQKNRVLFSNPYSMNSRANGTVMLSYDEGGSWAYRKTVQENFFAYSCLTLTQDNKIGLLYEGDDYQSIQFQKFTLEWLTNGNDSYANGTSIADKGIKDKADEIKIHLYPNPVKDEYQIQFYLNRPSIIIIEIYNILGQKIEKKPPFQGNEGWNSMKCSINKEVYPNGIYLIKLNYRKNQIVKKMMIIN